MMAEVTPKLEKGAFKVTIDPNEPLDINIELKADGATISPEQEQLYLKIEETNTVIKSLDNTAEDIKRKYIKELFAIAQLGLSRELVKPALALKSLNNLKAEMVSIEGRRIKNSYLQRLGKKALVLAGVASLIALGLHSVSAFAFAFPQVLPAAIDAQFLHDLHIYPLSFIGAMAGTWISFGARKYKLTFENLSLPERDMMNQWQRLIYIGLATLIVVLFLQLGLFRFELGQWQTDELTQDFKTALIIGIVCGLIETKIGVNLFERAKTVLPVETPPNQTPQN